MFGYFVSIWIDDRLVATGLLILIEIIQIKRCAVLTRIMFSHENAFKESESEFKTLDHLTAACLLVNDYD